MFGTLMFLLISIIICGLFVVGIIQLYDLHRGDKNHRTKKEEDDSDGVSLYGVKIKIGGQVNDGK